MFCRPAILCLLNCIPETTQVTEGLPILISRAPRPSMCWPALVYKMSKSVLFETDDV